jgi:hypothetical protein
MKNYLPKICLVLLLFSITLANAQDESAIQAETNQKNAATFYFGFPGIGLGYARQFNDHLSARIKGSIFSLSIVRQGLDLSGRKVDVDAPFKFNTIDLLLDYNPFKESSFKIVAGLSYLANAKTNIVIKPAGGIKYGDIDIPQEQVGDVKAGSEWKGIAPYLALGFGRAVPTKTVGFGFEIGGHFIGKPDTYFTASQMLKPTEAEESAEFRSWMEKFTFMPSLMFHLNYKF